MYNNIIYAYIGSSDPPPDLLTVTAKQSVDSSLTEVEDNSSPSGKGYYHSLVADTTNPVKVLACGGTAILTQ